MHFVNRKNKQIKNEYFTITKKKKIFYFIGLKFFGFKFCNLTENRDEVNRIIQIKLSLNIKI